MKGTEMNVKKITIVALCLGALVIISSGGCKERQPAAAGDAAVAAAATFANIKCPIMGSPIVPDKVPANLIREYKGQKIGFCCAGCPQKWDALWEQDKVAKLAAAQ
ncbi:MAG: hypothetical protein IH624_10405 [Phycisphaerae bacterium]|nr:hypothetical protein [Phycisphaerae bacterium]